MMPLIIELIEHEAEELFFIKWDNEPICEGAAFMLCGKYSLGSCHKPVWTLWFGQGIERSAFKSKIKAHERIRQIFATAKAKKGQLIRRRKIHGKWKYDLFTEQKER